MKQSIKNVILSKAAIGGLILGTCAFSAHDVQANDFTSLGSGSEVRSYLHETNSADLIASLQQEKKTKSKEKTKTSESKSKEGKCGEGKCGEGKKAKKESSKEETNAKKESKSKEGKCGEGKCGAE